MGVIHRGAGPIRGQRTERRQITWADAPARTCQEAHERGIRGRVIEDIEDGAHLGDYGHVE